MTPRRAGPRSIFLHIKISVKFKGRVISNHGKIRADQQMDKIKICLN